MKKKKLKDEKNWQPGYLFNLIPEQQYTWRRRHMFNFKQKY